MTIPKRFIADASFALPWLFSDEQDTASEAAWEALKNREAEAIIPQLWLWEISNVLILNEHRNRVSQTDVEAFFEVLKHLPIQIHNESINSIFDKLPKLMRRHKLTAYDAEYLMLALSLDLPIGTLDKALQKAAQAEGLTLFS